MPYLSKNKYATWLYYIKRIIGEINAINKCDLTGEPEYYIGFRYKSHKICLIKDEYVYARGMYQIEKYVLMLKALYLDRRSE